MSKTEIWDKLGVTNPEHTKGFSRAGGFQGTAVKPQWVLHRLTEEFGPAGVGWGANEPSFQIVPCGDEILVFCKVSCWHGSRENVIWGVGGDKAVAMRKGAPFSDDEAFKKAFTDAVMNAFKFIGVAADVHMGMFDDSKYVVEAQQRFAAGERKSAAQAKRDGDHETIKAELAQCQDLETLGVWFAQRMPHWKATCPASWEDPIDDLYHNRRNEITDAAMEQNR